MYLYCISLQPKPPADLGKYFPSPSVVVAVCAVFSSVTRCVYIAALSLSASLKASVIVRSNQQKIKLWMDLDSIVPSPPYLGLSKRNFSDEHQSAVEGLTDRRGILPVYQNYASLEHWEMACCHKLIIDYPYLHYLLTPLTCGCGQPCPTKDKGEPKLSG